MASATISTPSGRVLYTLRAPGHYLEALRAAAFKELKFDMTGSLEDFHKAAEQSNSGWAKADYPGKVSLDDADHQGRLGYIARAAALVAALGQFSAEERIEVEADPETCYHVFHELAANIAAPMLDDALDGLPPNVDAVTGWKTMIEWALEEMQAAEKAMLSDARPRDRKSAKE